MNLLDQLYQYSLRTASSSISFSALQYEDNLSLSLNSTSPIHSSQSSAFAALLNLREHARPIDCLLRFDQPIHSQQESKAFCRKMGHYRKLNGLLEILSNKIRKTYYEFIVKLQNCSKSRLTLKSSKEALADYSPLGQPNSQNLTKVKTTSSKSIHIISSKVSFTFESSFTQCKVFAQNVSCMLGTIHPQRRQLENPDFSNNVNVFISRNDYFKSGVSPLSNDRELRIEDTTRENQTKQLSVLQNRPDLVSKSELQRRSVLTTFAGQISQIQEHDPLKAFNQYLQQLSQQFPQCWCQQHNKPFIPQKDGYSSKSPRFIFEEQQKELKNYIIYRRSIDKRRNSTLKEIEKSKQTIKKIVYELRKSKSKPQKQKIKLNAKKVSLHDKTQNKQASLGSSKPCSPSRQQSVGTKQRFDSAKKQHCNESIAVSSRLRVNSNSHKKDHQQAQCPSLSSNLQVYSNYIKAKRCLNMPQDLSAKKQLCKTTRQPEAEKRSSHKKVQNNLLNISKQPVQGGKRIDLKIDFTKSSKGKLALECQKPKGKKSHK